MQAQKIKRNQTSMWLGISANILVENPWPLTIFSCCLYATKQSTHFLKKTKGKKLVLSYIHS